jgi:hypothetical protein
MQDTPPDLFQKSINRAASALQNYAAITDEDFILRDLLADLRHWARKNQVDYAFEDSRAEQTYLQELKHQEP